MVDSYLSTNFGINLLDGFWENAFYGRTDDGRTTDARATALALLTQSSRAKKQFDQKAQLWITLVAKPTACRAPTWSRPSWYLFCAPGRYWYQHTERENIVQVSYVSIQFKLAWHPEIFSFWSLPKIVWCTNSLSSLLASATGSHICSMLLNSTQYQNYADHI